MLVESPTQSKSDPYGSNRPSPIPSPTEPGGEPIPKPGLPDQYPGYLKPIPVNTRDVVGVMRGHLNNAEPKVQRWLYSTWNAGADSIKYQELRNAVRDNQMQTVWLSRWQQDYADFVNEKLGPQWEKMLEQGGLDLAESARAAGFDIHGGLDNLYVRQWIQHRGGELAVAFTDSQYEAVRRVLEYYIARPDSIGPQQLGRILRPIVGLTPGQATAVRRYRERLIEEGATLKKVDHLVGNYASWLHRIRAERIARTEMAFAYNMGQFRRIQMAIEDGDLLGVVVKEFLTAEDERVCPHCGPLDGQTVEMEQTFPGATNRLPNLLTPPLHPGCRCTILYELLRRRKR